MGHIQGPYGLKGWVKIWSGCDPREMLLQYDPWYVGREGEWQQRRLCAGKRHGNLLVAQLEGCEDRDHADALRGLEIAVERERLPLLAEGEYYWADLVGLQVVTLDGVDLGRVERLFETGANDVVVVQGERERLLPWLRGSVIHEIDLAAGRLRVDWDPEF